MNTPTPRTDAATYSADCLGKTLVTNRDCARELERELTAITAERDQLRATIAEMPTCRCGLSTDDQCELTAKLGAATAERDQLKEKAKDDFEMFHGLRMKLTAACGDPYKMHDEALDCLIAERDQLRADCENETKWAAHYLADALAAKARAERADAELAAERARRDDLVADISDACITLASAIADCDEYALQNTEFKLTAIRDVLQQYIPNAAMKGGVK